LASCFDRFFSFFPFFFEKPQFFLKKKFPQKSFVNKKSQKSGISPFAAKFSPN